MKIQELMINIAADLNNGVSRQNACIYWDINIDTLSFYESTRVFHRCMEIAKHRKRLRVPNLLPDEMKKCGLMTCAW